MTFFRVVLALTCLAAPAVAAIAAVDVPAAAALYEGRAPDSAGEVLLGDMQLPAAGFACKGCHGRDGRGGGESVAPAIDGATLARAAPERPAYDARTFASLLASGRTPAGRELSAVMPRYRLPPALAAGLFAYLQELPQRQRRGVLPHSITLAVPAPPDAQAVAETYAAALQRRFAADAGRIYGREVRVVALRGTSAQIAAAAAADALAVVGLPPSATLARDDFVQHGLPLLLPLAPLAGDEDASLVRALAPSWRQIAAGLVPALQARRITRLQVMGGDPAHPLLAGLSRAGWKGRVLRANPDPDANPDSESDPASAPAAAPAPGTALLLLGPARRDAAGPRQLPAGLPLFVPSGSGGAGALDALRQGRDMTVIVEAPALFDAALAHAGSLLEAHAAAAAAVLAETLRRAGPDPTRAGLVAAFDGLVLEDQGLDYRAAPLTGTADVRLLTETPPRSGAD
jgi:hypothetical protein